MNRDEMIKWLKENTIREQWGDNHQLPKTCAWRFSDSRLHDCNYRSVLRKVINGLDSDIFFENVFEQPVFIDGAEYFIRPLRNLGYPTNQVRFKYELKTNRFIDHDRNWLNASDFGKHFTVELAVMGQPPETPEYLLTGKGNINALSNYLNLKGASVDIIAAEALSRLKEQAVIVGRVGKLNEFCQKHGIGEWGDSVIDSVINHIEKQAEIHKAAKLLIESSFAHLGSLHFKPKVMNSNFHTLAKILNIDVTRGDNVTPDTLELPTVPEPKSDEFLTHLRNIYGNPNATLDGILDDYRKCADKCDQIAKSELPTTSLYDRVLKALGERDVPIRGEDHLVGQVKVDSRKAKILDKVVEEFNIPVGGNIIQWLHNRTNTQKKPEPVFFELVNYLGFSGVFNEKEVLTKALSMTESPQ